MKKMSTPDANNSVPCEKAAAIDFELDKLTAEQKQQVRAFLKRMKEKSTPSIKIDRGNKNQLLPEDGDEHPLFNHVQIMNALGTTSAHFMNSALAQIERTFFCLDRQDFKVRENNLNAALAMLSGIEPKDEIEGMLAVQMVGAHNLAMEFMQRAMIHNQTFEGVESAVNRSTKFLRTFLAQVEALNRHRGKGQQKVTVEHVTVNSGGQAIVGAVTNGAGGGQNGKQ